MLVFFYLLLIAVSLVIVTIAATEFVNGIYRFRGPRVVSCPEDGKNVGIEIDARHAAAANVRRRDNTFRVTKCTSWPDRGGCNEACLSQLEKDPDASLLRNKLEPWYREHACALCGGSVKVIPPDGTGPGFITRDGRRKLGWDELPLSNYPESLDSVEALCVTCRSGARA